MSKQFVCIIIFLLRSACLFVAIVPYTSYSEDGSGTQDLYIIEAIKQIELNKTEIVSKNQKEFISVYTYRASDTDSKMSARQKASTELKRILLEEIGVHIRSSLNINQQMSADQRVSAEVSYVINSYTAGSVSMEILEEKWDGYNFYIRGRIKIDPDSVIEGIAQGLKAEAEKKQLQRWANY